MYQKDKSGISGTLKRVCSNLGIKAVTEAEVMGIQLPEGIKWETNDTVQHAAKSVEKGGTFFSSITSLFNIQYVGPDSNGSFVAISMEIG